MGIMPLEQVQLGEESAWGTANATPTAKIMGVEDCEIVPMVTTLLHNERRGTLAPGYNTNISEVGGTGSLNLLASYEDLPYLFESLFSEATPGSAPGYARTYAAPLLALPSPKPITLYKGQSGATYRLEGALGNQLTLSGESGQPMKASVNYEGTRVVDGTLASLSDRTVNFMMGDQASLFIDTWAGTMGSTEVTATSWSFQMTINANRKFNRSLGSLAPVSWHDGDSENKWGGELKLSLELTSGVATYLSSILTASPAVLQRQIRIRYSLDATHVATFDFAGTLLEAPTLFSDMDGLVSVDLVLTGTYNTALGNWFTATITNAVAALP